jgi:hypothetical protein
MASQVTGFFIGYLPPDKMQTPSYSRIETSILIIYCFSSLVKTMEFQSIVVKFKLLSVRYVVGFEALV